MRGSLAICLERLNSGMRLIQTSRMHGEVMQPLMISFGIAEAREAEVTDEGQACRMVGVPRRILHIHRTSQNPEGRRERHSTRGDFPNNRRRIQCHTRLHIPGQANRNNSARQHTPDRA